VEVCHRFVFPAAEIPGFAGTFRCSLKKKIQKQFVLGSLNQNALLNGREAAV